MTLPPSPQLRRALLLGTTLAVACALAPACKLSEAPKKRSEPAAAQSTHPEPGEKPERQPSETNQEQSPDLDTLARQADQSELLTFPWMQLIVEKNPWVEPAHHADVVALIGDQAITIGDTLALMQAVPHLAGAHFDSDVARRQWLDRLVEVELLTEVAQAEGLLDTEVTELAAWNAAARLVRFARLESLAAAVDAEAIEAYTQAHAGRFTRPERRRGNLIVVPTTEQAEALRRDILARQPERSPGRVPLFESFARSTSIDEGTRHNDGRLGWATRDADTPFKSSVSAAIVEALFALEPFEISQPIALDGGAALVINTQIVKAYHTQPALVARTARYALAQPQELAQLADLLQAWRQRDGRLDGDVWERFTCEKSGCAVAAEADLQQRVIIGPGPGLTLALLQRLVQELPPGHQERVVHGPWRQAFTAQVETLAALLAEAEQAGYLDTFAVAHAKRAAAVTALRARLALAVRAEIDDAEIEAYYRDHPEEFIRPERRRAMVVAYASQEEAEGVRAEIMRLEPSLRGDALRTHAATTSKDQRWQGTQGVLPYIALDDETFSIDVAMREALFALDVGDVSPAVEVDALWYLIYFDAQRPAQQVAMTQARTVIRARLSKAPMSDFLEEVRQEQQQERALRLFPEVLGLLAGDHVH